MWQRILADIFIIISALVAPWWITVILVFFGLIYFESYIEAFFIGAIIDAIYSTANTTILGLHYFFAIFFIVIYFILLRLKKSVRF